MHRYTARTLALPFSELPPQLASRHLVVVGAPPVVTTMRHNMFPKRRAVAPADHGSVQFGLQLQCLQARRFNFLAHLPHNTSGEQHPPSQDSASCTHILLTALCCFQLRLQVLRGSRLRQRHGWWRGMKLTPHANARAEQTVHCFRGPAAAHRQASLIPQPAWLPLPVPDVVRSGLAMTQTAKQKLTSARAYCASILRKRSWA